MIEGRNQISIFHHLSPKKYNGGLIVVDRTFGLGVYWIRQIRRITLEKLAAQSKLSDSYISLIENGQRPGTPQSREAIAQALGFTCPAIELVAFLIPELIDAITARDPNERVTMLQALRAGAEERARSLVLPDSQIQRILKALP